MERIEIEELEGERKRGDRYGSGEGDCGVEGSGGETRSKDLITDFTAS